MAVAFTIYYIIFFVIAAGGSACIAVFPDNIIFVGTSARIVETKRPLLVLGCGVLVDCHCGRAKIEIGVLKACLVDKLVHKVGGVALADTAKVYSQGIHVGVTVHRDRFFGLYGIVFSAVRIILKAQVGKTFAKLLKGRNILFSWQLLAGIFSVVGHGDARLACRKAVEVYAVIYSGIVETVRLSVHLLGNLQYIIAMLVYLHLCACRSGVEGVEL